MPLADVLEEAKRIMQAAEQQQLVLRLVGGIAIKLHCPSAEHRNLARAYPDIDFFSYTKLSKRLGSFFQELEYEPAKLFNALQGKRKLLFMDANNRRRVDIFLDVFEMCHKFDFRNRLELDRWTLAPADLLVTKLQVIEMNEKDYKDIVALLLDHEIGDDDGPEMINGRYLSKLCAKEWGIHRTFTRNLGWVSDALDKYVDSDENMQLVKSRIDALLHRIEQEPKTLQWKARATVGEKVQWYELPEAPKIQAFENQNEDS